MIQNKCPNCGANLTETDNMLKCKNCGSVFQKENTSTSNSYNNNSTTIINYYNEPEKDKTTNQSIKLKTSKLRFLWNSLIIIACLITFVYIILAFTTTEMYTLLFQLAGIMNEPYRIDIYNTWVIIDILFTAIVTIFNFVLAIIFMKYYNFHKSKRGKIFRIILLIINFLCVIVNIFALVSYNIFLIPTIVSITFFSILYTIFDK